MQPHFEEVAPAEASIFLDKIRTAKKAQKHGASVDLKPLQDLIASKMFLTRDGLAGYAVSPEGELHSVFKHPSAPYEDVARHAAEHGILMGGASHASAFDGFLTEGYARGGMKAVAYQPFADEYKPANWKFKVSGRPDVAFLAADRNVAHPAISAKQTGQKFYSPAFQGGLRAMTTNDNDFGYLAARAIGQNNNEDQLGSQGKNVSK